MELLRLTDEPLNRRRHIRQPMELGRGQQPAGGEDPSRALVGGDEDNRSLVLFSINLLSVRQAKLARSSR
jgi:hypothetical protein